MASLYQIEEEFFSIVNEIEENGGELTPELENRLTIVRGDFDKKALNYCWLSSKLQGEVNEAQNEVSRIESYIKLKTNILNRLNKALLDALKLFGTKDPKKNIWRHEVGNYKLSTRSSVSTEITDFDVLPDEYKRAAVSLSNLSLEERNRILNLLDSVPGHPVYYKVEEDALKTPIKEAIQAGVAVEGAELRTNYSLNLR